MRGCDASTHDLSRNTIGPQSKSFNFFPPSEGSITSSPCLPSPLPSNSSNDVFSFNSSSPYLFQAHHAMCPPLWSLFNLYNNWCTNRHLQELSWKQLENSRESSEGSNTRGKSPFNSELKTLFGTSIPHREGPKHPDDPIDSGATFHIDGESLKLFSHSRPSFSNDSGDKRLERRRITTKSSKPVNWMLPDEECTDSARGRSETFPSFVTFEQTTSPSAPQTFRSSNHISPFSSPSDFGSKCRMLFSLQHAPFIAQPMISSSYRSPTSDVKLPMFGTTSLRPGFHNFFPKSADDHLTSKEDTTPYSPGDSRTDLTVVSNQRQVLKPPSIKVEPPPRFQCEACQKSYSTFNGLTKHKEFHCSTYVKKQFLCPHCESKCYASLGALKMHIRTHTLPCKCKLCGKAFSRPWLLQGHLRTHTGERPFECSHCSRAFADRSNLRAHLQTHCDVKRYNCQTCRKSFSRMSLLLKHKESQTCS